MGLPFRVSQHDLDRAVEKAGQRAVVSGSRQSNADARGTGSGLAIQGEAVHAWVKHLISKLSICQRHR